MKYNKILGKIGRYFKNSLCFTLKIEYFIKKITEAVQYFKYWCI